MFVCLFVWLSVTQKASVSKSRPVSAGVLNEKASLSSQAQCNQQAIVSALRKLVEKQAARQYSSSSHISLLTQHVSYELHNYTTLHNTRVMRPRCTRGTPKSCSFFARVRSKKKLEMQRWTVKVHPDSVWKGAEHRDAHLWLELASGHWFICPTSYPSSLLVSSRFLSLAGSLESDHIMCIQMIKRSCNKDQVQGRWRRALNVTFVKC